MIHADTDLEAAWAGIRDNMPAGWYIGPPFFDEGDDQWKQYAVDPRQKPVVGERSDEWIAVGPTELRCLQEMVRCLAGLREGRWPK